VRVIFLAVLALTVTVVVAPSHAQMISVFADSLGTRCDVPVHPGTPGHAYLLFHQGTLSGIAGWACRVQGLPSGWFGFADPGPGPLPFDNYLFEGGTVWAWPTCQNDNPLVLAWLTIIATTEEDNVGLLVMPRTPLVNPELDCALVTQCDAPVYTATCVAGGTAIINATEPCVIAVTRSSWSKIKRLYD
jgi:hypothetical protein